MTETATVTNIEYLDEDDAYDLTVEEDHSYMLSNGIMSHNSTLIMQVALHMARKGARVILVSLEMDRKMITRRMLSHLTGVPLTRINAAHTLDDPTLRLLKRSWHKYHEQVRNNNGRLQFVSPPEDMSMDEILAMYRPRKPDMLGVDYLGLTRGMDGEDQWRKMGSAVRTCARMASTDNNIIALLCQLSPDGLIRYSRTIMEHAYLAWTWTYVDDAVRESRIITINQPKTRNLRSFPFHLRENFATMRFDDLDPNEEREHRKNRPSKRGKGKSQMGHNGGPPPDDQKRRGRFEQADFHL